MLNQREVHQLVAELQDRVRAWWCALAGRQPELPVFLLTATGAHVRAQVDP